jgi:hypothetical protein
VVASILVADPNHHCQGLDGDHGVGLCCPLYVSQADIDACLAMWSCAQTADGRGPGTDVVTFFPDGVPEFSTQH